MPFRRYFADRGLRHPVAYSMLTLAMGMLACMVISVSISVAASNRAIRQDETQEEMERQRATTQAERNKQAVCTVIDRMSAAYNDETVPVTKTGRAAGKAWQDLHETFQCDNK